ncbi:anti-sigma factor family protein [Paenibacillus sp. YAF4_2]|uniref:anti-sigma factor family protein n=1 Tax=Paenibacillus sp. YAF4_2 TaxID=3233085 RepID=UPI003F98D7C3
MTCQEVIEYMNRQLDDDLNEHEYEILMKHTRHCPDCAAMFERLKKLSEELGNLPQVMPRFSLVDAILPKLEFMEPIRLPEAAAVEIPAVTIPSQQSNRRAKARHQLRFRAISGIIAASVAAGLFLVSYNAGLFSPSHRFSDADNASTAAASSDKMSADTFMPDAKVQPYSNDTKGAVSTETDRSFAKEDQSMTNQLKSEGTSANTGNSSGNGVPSEEPQTGSNAPTGDAPSISDPTVGSENGSGPTLGITSDPAQLEAASPDGQYIAKVTGFVIHVYKSGEVASVFEARKNGKFANLVWSDDNKQLTYDIQLESGGMERYVISTDTMTESKASH